MSADENLGLTRFLVRRGNKSDCSHNTVTHSLAEGDEQLNQEATAAVCQTTDRNMKITTSSYLERSQNNGTTEDRIERSERILWMMRMK